MGIRNDVNDWFRSFLSNREYFVAIDEGVSTVYEPRLGVPQGAVLAPLLLLIYGNDIVRPRERSPLEKKTS